jgi:hypothetical protein
MIGTAAVISHPGGPRALLITELPVRLPPVTSTGDRTGPALDVLLAGGLHLLPRIEDRAPACPGWLLLLHTRWKAAVLDPDGRTFYFGELEQPRVWRKIVRRQRAVELVAGVTGLRSAAVGPRESLALLAGAARSGCLVGGTIALHRQRDVTSS